MMLHPGHTVLRCFVVLPQPGRARARQLFSVGAWRQQVRAVVAPDEAWDVTELLIIFEGGPLLLDRICNQQLLRWIRVPSGFV